MRRLWETRRSYVEAIKTPFDLQAACNAGSGVSARAQSSTYDHVWELPITTASHVGAGGDGAYMTGQTITHYRVGEKLGQGASAVVYRAEDLALGREVVIKFFSPDGDGSIARFQPKRARFPA